jgi:hypothetical protein
MLLFGNAKTSLNVKHSLWGPKPVILLQLLYKALMRLRSEYGTLLFHKLQKKQSELLEKVQHGANMQRLSHQNSTL